MNRLAIEQAKQRLSKAKRAVSALKAATSFDDAEAAWIDFLMASSSIYSKLEQGAKGFNKSEPWFGRKRKERRDDPLLRYLHYARNSEEHGIERTVGMTPPNRDGMGRPLKFNERAPVKFRVHNKETNLPEGPEMEGVFAGPTLKPIRVHDRRFNDFCDPPRMHMGQYILFADFSDGVAEAVIPYLAALIAEAEALSS